MLYGVKTNPVLLAMLIAFLAALFADSATVHIVRRFKKLKMQIPNIYIFHISVLNIMNFVVCVGLIAVELYRNKWHIENLELFVRWMHLVLDVIFSLVFVQFALMTIAIIDWYLYLFAPQKSGKFRKHTSTILTSAYVYLVTVSMYSCAVTVLYGFPGFLSAILLPVIFFVSLILHLGFLVIYQCRRSSLQKPNANLLMIALVRMTLWFTFLLNILNAVINSGKVPFLSYVVVVFLLLTILLPVFQLVLLYLYDENYKTALLKVFNCRRNRHDSEDSVEEGAMVYSTSNSVITRRFSRSASDIATSIT